MGIVDKNYLSGETCGNRLCCRLLGWFACLALLGISIYLIYSYLAMSTWRKSLILGDLISIGIILFCGLFTFAIWPLLRCSLRCLWLRDTVSVRENYLEFCNYLSTGVVIAGVVNLFWLIFFKVLCPRDKTLDFLFLGPYGLWIFLALFFVINTVVLWAMFSFSRQLKKATVGSIPEPLTKVFNRLPWLCIVELGCITGLYVMASYIPFADQLNLIFKVILWLTLGHMLLLLPLCWSIKRENDAMCINSLGYGLGCRRPIPRVRWVVVAVLRFSFVLIYFIFIWSGFGILGRFISCFI